jgi:hypothetical protein
MKTPLSFYLIAAVAGALACSDEGGNTRDNTGGTGPTGVAGSSSNTGGSAGSAGSGAQNTSGAGGGGSAGGPSTSAAFEITAATANDNGATALVVDAATGIDGVAQLIKSAQGTVVTNGIKDGQLCMSGTTAIVPQVGGMADYTNYWGAEIDVDLKLVDMNGNGSASATVADAGADAGGDAGGPPPARSATGYDTAAAHVAGFSFKVTGAQVPVSFRFKGLPYGADSSNTTYCNQLAATDGATLNIRFDQITFECWAPGGAALGTMPYTDNPTGKLLRTISWQVPADINAPIPFDFCVSDLKAILAN